MILLKRLLGEALALYIQYCDAVFQYYKCRISAISICLSTVPKVRFWIAEIRSEATAQAQALGLFDVLKSALVFQLDQSKIAELGS